jgi:hypothetical protein
MASEMHPRRLLSIVDQFRSSESRYKVKRLGQLVGQLALVGGRPRAVSCLTFLVLEISLKYVFAMFLILGCNEHIMCATVRSTLQGCVCTSNISLLPFPCGCEEAALFGDIELDSDIFFISQARVLWNAIVVTLVCCL